MRPGEELVKKDVAVAFAFHLNPQLYAARFSQTDRKEQPARLLGSTLYRPEGTYYGLWALSAARTVLL